LVATKDLKLRQRSNKAGVPDRDSEDREVYLPGRNLLLLTKAAVFCAEQGISVIAMGSLKQNPFPDATPAFFRSLEKAISLALDFPVKIMTPFLQSSKLDVIHLGQRLGVPFESCFSCLAPKSNLQACGNCNKCAEKERALGLARMEFRGSR
jgi:7-cyano-7-deazaguanine synthase